MMVEPQALCMTGVENAFREWLGPFWYLFFLSYSHNITGVPGAGLVALSTVNISW